MAASAQRLRDFIARVGGESRLAIVASGGTCVPLDRCGVRFMDNFSTGRRGSCIAEELLRHNYHVVFVYREGTCRPFLRDAVGWGDDLALMDGLELSEDGSIRLVPPESQQESVRTALANYRQYKDKLVVLKFRTMWEYRNVIEQLSHDTKHLGANVIWFLTAAVMDFEIPDAQMPQNKVPSNAPMNITLMPTPKIRNIVRGIIGKAPTMCCFKLETDPNVLIQRAKVLLDEPTMADAVVANILDQRYDRVEIVFPDSTSQKIDAKKESIEKEIVDALIQVHHRKASRF